MLAQRLGLSLPTIKSVSGAGYENLYSLDFDGVDDYVNCGSSSNLSINSSGGNRGFSISFWVKTTSSSQIMLSKYKHTFFEEWAVFIGKSGAMQFTVYGNDSATIMQQLVASGTPISNGSWHHVVCTFNLASASSSLAIYIDATAYTNGSGATYASLGTWSASINTAADMYINDTPGIAGNIDEVAIFDDVLSPSEVTALYNSGSPTDLSGEPYLMGWWRNGDTAGTSVYPTINDYSSNSNNGTMTNMSSGDIVTEVP